MSEKNIAVKEPFDIKNELFDWAQALTNAIIFVILLFSFVARVFSVSGPSMQNTLQDGEMLLITRLFYTPDRGDIVMFSKVGVETDYETGTSKPLVKRIVGIAGDVIHVDYDTNTVSVNGEIVPEPFIYAESDPLQVPPKFSDTDFSVPDGHVFVMGDHRNNSRDSRDPTIGVVDTKSILGHVILRLFPFSSFGHVS